MRGSLRVSILALTLLCLALYVQPTVVDVEGGQFDHVFTIVNDDPRPITATLELHEFARYLQDTHTISATTIALRPGESRNVQVRGRVPSALGPETHLLRYELVSNGQRQDAFTLRIPVTGTPRLHPALDVRAQDVLRQEPLAATAQLSNFGNVIAYYNLSLHVRQEATPIGTIEYPRLVQVLPGEQTEIGLLYTDRLEPGEYSVRLQAVVNEERSLDATVPFRVLLDDQVYRTRQGDDLILTLSGTAQAQSITYVLSRNNRELVRDVLIAENDTVIVPTSLLEPGEYVVAVTVTHPSGTDTTRILLEVRPRSVYGTGVLISVGIMALISLLFTRTARIHIRISIVSFKLRKQEKRLKQLIEKAHQLT